MKNAILVILLFISSISFAQFDLSSSVGFGIEINKQLDYQLFQTTVTIEPQYKIDKITLSSQSEAMQNDSNTLFYTGLKAGYEFWNKENKSLQVTGHALIGTEGRKKLGGGLTYVVDNISLNLDLSQEYKAKTFVGILSVGFYLTR